MGLGESLLDLELNLRSKKEKLSSQEAQFIINWKENALGQLAVGAGAASAIVLAATVKANLSPLFCSCLGAGAGSITGMWRFRQSLDSCVEQILCMDGSRMQKELANIMLKRYPDRPETKKHISKHFYCENVFDDTTSDIPKSRWRFRNNFVESAAHPRQADTHESNVHDVKIGSDRKPVHMNNEFVAMKDPFDCVFGVPPSVEEIQRVVPTTSPRKHSRKHKRSHRKHHTHHQED